MYFAFRYCGGYVGEFAACEVESVGVGEGRRGKEREEAGRRGKKGRSGKKREGEGRREEGKGEAAVLDYKGIGCF